MTKPWNLEGKEVIFPIDICCHSISFVKHLEMGDREELLNKLDERIKFGEELVTQLQEVQVIDGVLKLQRKIRQEVEFLKRVSLPCYPNNYNSKAVLIMSYFRCKNLEKQNGNISPARTFAILRPW